MLFYDVNKQTNQVPFSKKMDGFFWKLNVVNVAFTTITHETVDIVKRNASAWNLFVVTLSLLVTRILGIHVIPWCVEVSHHMALTCLGYLTVHRYILAKFDIFQCITFTPVKICIKALLCAALPVIFMARLTDKPM